MMKKVFIALVVLIGISGTANAQFWKDIFKNANVQKAVTGLTGGEELTTKKLNGNWTYIKPSVTLEGDDPLKNLAGSVAAVALEEKIREYSLKAGIKEGEFKFTFNNDRTFSGKVKGGTFKGTYTLDSRANTMTFGYEIAGFPVTSLTAKTVLLGNNLSLLFEADKLLDFIIAVSDQVNNEQLNSVAKLLGQYQGINVGVELRK